MIPKYWVGASLQLYHLQPYYSRHSPIWYPNTITLTRELASTLIFAKPYVSSSCFFFVMHDSRLSTRSTGRTNCTEGVQKLSRQSEYLFTCKTFYKIILKIIKFQSFFNWIKFSIELCNDSIKKWWRHNGVILNFVRESIFFLFYY